MNIKVRLLGFWRRHDILFLCAWAIALSFWLYSYTVEIGADPVFFGVYAVAGMILVSAMIVFIRSLTSLSAPTVIEVWSRDHPDEFQRLQQEYQDGEFTVFSKDVEKILQRGRKQK